MVKKTNKDGNRYDKVFANASKEVLNRISNQHTPKTNKQNKKSGQK